METCGPDSRLKTDIKAIMIHKAFNFDPNEITGYLYSKTAKIFTVKMKNNAVIHYQTDTPETFLLWLKENGASARISPI